MFSHLLGLESCKHKARYFQRRIDGHLLARHFIRHFYYIFQNLDIFKHLLNFYVPDIFLGMLYVLITESSPQLKEIGFSVIPIYRWKTSQGEFQIPIKSHTAFIWQIDNFNNDVGFQSSLSSYAPRSLKH